MAIKTKSILAPIEQHDGTRVSVMSRHTLKDGITPHPEITVEMYDFHMPDLAPPAKLIGDYYKRGIGWVEFENRYLEYLESEKAQDAIRLLSGLALNRTVTILCIEEEDSKCHRRLLLEKINS